MQRERLGEIDTRHVFDTWRCGSSLSFYFLPIRRRIKKKLKKKLKNEAINLPHFGQRDQRDHGLDHLQRTEQVDHGLDPLQRTEQIYHDLDHIQRTERSDRSRSGPSRC